MIEPPHARCPCGGSDYLKLWEATYERSFPAEYRYALFRCTSCGLVRTAPVPDASMYDGLDFTSDTASKERPWLGTLDRESQRLLQDRTAGLPVLDLGCNTGELVALLGSAGVTAVGCDIDPKAINLGRSRGLELIVANPEDRPLPGQYGLVMCVHTLEHTTRPADLVRNTAGSMPGGALLHIRVPNFGGLLPRLMRNRWGFLVPFQHVWQFTHRTLADLVTREGLFEVESISSRAHLEYRTGGAKGTVKQLARRVAVAANASDEIRATFRRR